MSINKNAVREQLAKLQQAKAGEEFEPVWRSIVEKLGEEKAKAALLAKMGIDAKAIRDKVRNKGGRPKEAKGDLLQDYIDDLKSRGEKISPKAITDFFLKYRVALIPGSGGITFSGPHVSAALEKMWSIIEGELKAKGVGERDIEAATREAFANALHKFFGPDVEIGYREPDAERDGYTESGVKRAVNRIKNDKNLARPYTKG